MHQVLFRIPLPSSWAPDGLPIYGFGLMLFLAYLLGTWLACRRAEREGLSRDLVQDITIWIFVGGLAGARITYLIFHEKIFHGRLWPPAEFLSALGDFVMQLPRIWDGGIILYGSVVGGVLGYFLGYYFLWRKQGVSTLQLADLFAPTVAVGVCLGRIGCLLNGCCYGQVACPSCPAIDFPLAATARFELVQAGYQTAAGFAMDTRWATLSRLDPGSSASRAGLEAGDLVTQVNHHHITTAMDLAMLINRGRLQGRTEVTLDVERAGQPFGPFTFRVPGVGFTVGEPSGKDSPGEGVPVLTIEPESAAARAGLKKGDRILRAALLETGKDTLRTDLRPIRSDNELTVLLSGNALNHNDPLRLVVRRGDKDETLPDLTLPSFGFQVRNVTQRVGRVQPGSPAAQKGLQEGDVILLANGQTIDSENALAVRLTQDWPRGESELSLKVQRAGQEVTLAPFEPRTIGLHPTQIYESISMFLILLVLWAVFPLRTSYGQVAATLMILYSIHRYLNELLRNDVRPVGFESYGSVFLLVAGLGLLLYLWYRPVPVVASVPTPSETRKSK